MANKFYELATNLKHLGAKWLTEKKLISRPIFGHVTRLEQSRASENIW